MLRYTTRSILIATALVLVSSSALADWARFRGPNGAGVGPGDRPTPTTWSESENLLWRVALPGAGSSSPIVVGDRVFVTCWSGYGMDRSDPGEQEQLRRHLISIDRKTGKTVWSKAVKPYLPEDEYRGMFTQHGYASHTPVSDGERVYVFFGKTGALAFDMEGSQFEQLAVNRVAEAGEDFSATPAVSNGQLFIRSSKHLYCVGLREGG